MSLVSRSALSADPPAPPAPPAPAPSSSPSLVPPRLISDHAAEYPAAAMRERREAVVLLELEIDTEGKVTDARAVHPDDADFDSAAIAAAKQFRFEPALRDGRPVASKIRYSYAFKLAPEAAPKPVPVESNTTGSLRGRLTDENTRASIAQAIVKVFQNTDPVRRVQVREVSSNADGTWSIDDLSPGPYHIKITASGYDDIEVDESIKAGVTSEISARLMPNAPREIVVKGVKPNTEITHHSMARDEIRTTPGTRSDPLLVVENLPGVARSPAPPQGALVVRGSSPRGTNIYMDGSWIPLAFHFGGLTSVIPSELVEQIDYFPGNLRAKYGRGVGGVIEIKTRSLRYDQKLHGVVQVDLLDGRVFAEAPVPFTDSWSFVAGARRSWLDAWIGPVLRDAGSNVNTAPYYYDYQAFAETRPSSTSRFRIGVYGGADALATVSDKIVESDPAVAGRNDVRYGYHRLQINHEAEPAQGVKSSLMISVGQNTEVAQFGRIDVRDTINILASRADLSFELNPMFKVHGGIDMLAAFGTLDLRVPNVPDVGDTSIRTFSSGGWTTYRKDETYVRPAGYVELEARPVRALTVIAGLRVDHTKELSDTTISPRLSVAYALNESHPKTTLRAGAGVYFQPPDPLDLLRDTEHQLKSQRGTQVSMGLEQELGRHLQLSLETYAKSFDRLSLPVNASGGGTQMKNIGTGSVFGAEAMLRTKSIERFTGWLTYSISRSVRQDGPDQPTRLFAYDQTHVLALLGSYVLGRGWTLGARFRYTTGMPFTPCRGGMIDATSSTYACVPGAPLSERLPAFHQLDLRVEKGWQFQSWKLSAYVDVLNVYNHKNPEGVAYSYDQSKREYQSGLPFLPILGVRGEL
ncbi:MAG: TonB-dependent receptor [Polyangiaceae bacterium]